MFRPPPPLPDLEPEPDGPVSFGDVPVSFGGLADVLEPDLDPDDETPVSMRRAPPASRRPSLRGEPAHPPPASRPAPIQIQDFAFADTVVANELADEEVPSSGPIFFTDGDGTNAQCVTPFAFPLPSADDDDVSARGHDLSTPAREGGFRRSLDEMRELWGSTAEIVLGDGEPRRTSFLFVRRVFALWSCFQWSRADVTRAALIGLGVFMVAGAVGATTMDLRDSAGGETAAGAGVRAGRTLDQHTGRKIVLRNKH